MRRGLSLGHPPGLRIALLAVLISAASAVAGCERLSALLEHKDEAPPTELATEGRGTRPARSSEARGMLDEMPPGIPPALASSLAERLGRRGAPDAGPRPVVLDPGTRRKMKMAPRRTAAPDVRFGKGRLGVLTADALVVRDVARLSQTLRIPLEEPRALTALADGSLLVMGAARSLRLMPQDQKAQRVPKFVLLPDSSSFGDRQNPDRVWVLPGSGKTLFGYDATRGAGSILVAAQWIELDGFDQRAIASLRDGSFVYTSASGLVQFYGTGPKAPLSATLDGAVRVLPGSRPDTVWIVGQKTAQLHRILAGKLVRLKSIDLSTTPYDADSAGEVLAVLELSQPDDAPWGFVLEVFDASGVRRCQVPLPARETFGEDWVRQLLRDRGLALSADPPLVAVGGGTHLDVLSTRDGSVVYSGP